MLQHVQRSVHEQTHKAAVHQSELVSPGRGGTDDGLDEVVLSVSFSLSAINFLSDH